MTTDGAGDGDRSEAPGSPGADGRVTLAERALDGHPRPDAVASRTDGRPPVESGSDDPDHQAQVILEESEERTAAGAAKSDPATDGGPPH
jgi:hypothetical protein